MTHWPTLDAELQTAADRAWTLDPSIDFLNHGSFGACPVAIQHTQDELQRLADRTDVLVTILASVDWERIDPELLQTRHNLEKAQDNIASLRSDANPDRQAEVAREIEKLEAFVTSSKFDYLEQASKG